MGSGLVSFTTASGNAALNLAPGSKEQVEIEKKLKLLLYNSPE
jgi:hypothetical protein